MEVYFVIGGVLVAWAIVLTFGGMARSDSPDKRGGRMLMAVSGVLCIAAFAALMATTEKEHPKEEAAEKAERLKEEREGQAPPRAAAGKVRVLEDEYSVKLAGDTLKPGKYTFEVANKGKISHDLAIEGGGAEEKTPLIDPGKIAALEADLKPGKYTFYCSVPGHEQQGMKTEVTVRKQ